MNTNGRGALIGIGLPIALLLIIGFIATISRFPDTDIFDWYLSTSSLFSGIWGFAFMYETCDPVNKSSMRWASYSFLLTTVLAIFVLGIITNNVEEGLTLMFLGALIITLLSFGIGAGFGFVMAGRPVRNRARNIFKRQNLFRDL